MTDLITSTLSAARFDDANGWGNDRALWTDVATQLVALAPALVGSEKQVAWATDLRAAATVRIAQVLLTDLGTDARDAHFGQGASERIVTRRTEARATRLSLVARALGTTSAKAWIDARSEMGAALGQTPAALTALLDRCGF